MVTVGIDLSMRSTGIVALDGDKCDYALLTTNAKKHNDEVLLRYNTKQIIDWIEQHKPDQIAIEGLSYNAKSGSKDLIAANYWYLRMELRTYYPNVPLHILPVTMWRSPLFTKEENKNLTADKKLLKIFKDDLKKLGTKAEKNEFTLAHEDLILRTNIKWLTFRKLSHELQEEFGTYGFSKGTFDLSDAWHIASYTSKTFPESIL